MNPNEAPEKIYLEKVYPDNGVLPNGLNYNQSSNDIEYIKKDAFIEKVVNFMEKIDNVDEYSWYNEEEHAVGITEKCIEDLKKYIEGE